MMLVILGHINFANQEIKPWIYSFHMPAFFFISGLTINDNKDITIKGLMTQITKYFFRLIVPYILWGMIYEKLTLANIAKLLFGSYKMIVDAGSLSSLWFLPVMFFSVVFFYACNFMLKKKFNIIARILMTVISFVIGFSLPHIKYGYPFSINITFIAFGFMMIGNIVRMSTQRSLVCARNKKRSILLCILFSAICFTGTMIYKLNIPNRGYILMGNAEYSNPLLFLSTALFGCGLLLLLSIALSLILNEKAIVHQWLSWFGQNTLITFAVQKPIIKVCHTLLNKIHISNSILLLLLSGIGTILVTGILCLLINWMAPVLAGKQEIKKPHLRKLN